MSNIQIIFAHPSHNSYNFSILQKVLEALRENDHHVEINDLCSSDFDPVMTEAELYKKYVPETILQEQKKVIWSDLLFFIYPVWWWGPPAILKGWLERVLCLDFAFKYDIKRNGFVGTLQDRKAVILSTSSSHPNNYALSWQSSSHTDSVSTILLESGIIIAKQLHFHNVHQYTPQTELAVQLNDVYSYAKSL